MNSGNSASGVIEVTQDGRCTNCMRDGAAPGSIQQCYGEVRVFPGKFFRKSSLPAMLT